MEMKRSGRLWIPEAPMLNLIRSVELELASPTMGIAGVYGYEVGPDLAAGAVRARGEFPNLVTDVGIEALGSGSNRLLVLTDYFGVGVGSAPPAFGDVGLQNPVGPRVNTTGGFSDVSGYNNTTDPTNPFHYRRRVRVWAKGAFGGDVSLTELGVFNASTLGICWSRQLFRDGGGSPTTISVKADEELKIWYEYRLYPPMTDTTQTITVKGTSITVTNRAVSIADAAVWGTSDAIPPALLSRFGNWGTGAGTVATYSERTLPARTSDLFAGSRAGSSSVVLAPYVGGSRTRGVSAQWSPSAGNFVGGKVGGFSYSPSGDADFRAPFFSHLSPSVIKTTEEYMNVDISCSWARTTNPTL